MLITKEVIKKTFQYFGIARNSDAQIYNQL